MKSRSDLPQIIKPDGIGIELGVATGYYSDIILQNSKLKLLYSVDRWCDHHDEKEYQIAATLLAKHVSRSVVMRMDFDTAFKHFTDDGTVFDFIYIDAYAHTGQQDGFLLYKWYLLLKSGGIIAGHDYNERYQPTIDAVDEFCESIPIKPIIIPGLCGTESVQDNYESWYFIKP